MCFPLTPSSPTVLRHPPRRPPGRQSNPGPHTKGLFGRHYLSSGDVGGFCSGPAQWLLKNAPGLPASGPLGCIHAFLLSSSLPSMSKCSLRTQQQKTYFQRPVFCLKKENLNLLLRNILYLLCAVGTTPEMLFECAVGTTPELLLECLCLGHLSHRRPYYVWYGGHETDGLHRNSSEDLSLQKEQSDYQSP